MHASMRQGHTERGQILGSPAAYGGSASTVALDLYRPAGRWGISWRRLSQQRLGTFLSAGEIEPLDVQHSLGAEGLLFRGRWELKGRLDGVYRFNRDFGDDVFGTSTSLSIGARL
jgi:hypothetical protein